MKTTGKNHGGNAVARALLGACLLAVLLAAAPARAGSGSALIDGYESLYSSISYNLSNWMEISNISASPVTVTVTLYRHDGSIITDDGSPVTGYVTSIDPGASYNDALTSATVSFDLAAHHTTRIALQAVSSDFEHGYGVIEWTSTDKELLAVMAKGATAGYQQAYGVSWLFPYNINGGKPF